MILSDTTIRQLMASGELVVDPLHEFGLQPASIDCTLGEDYLVVDEANTDLIRMDKPIHYREVKSDRMVIAPHSFLLATTREYLRLPNDLTAFVEGRSSVGRMGLFIQNAGWVDAGFEGRITLELYNANALPIEVISGRRICQLVFCKMDQAAQTPYRGKYQGQSRPVGSRIYQDDR